MDSGSPNTEVYWVTLPDGEAGIIVNCYNELGEECEPEVAAVIDAVDVNTDIQRFMVVDSTFKKPLLH